MNRTEFLIKDLPDAGSARRFLDEFTDKHAGDAAKLLKKEGLLSDVLTVVSYSPLLATTILQNPSYLWWLDPKRADSGVRDKEALVESLARFALTNSRIDTQVLLSRFRRRELLRIFLRDIRRLATIAEITEEISNLADAILEHALGLAAREMEKRYGMPQETDDKGRAAPASFCIVSLGKLGSKELNYSSDIDLLFIYSGEGNTSGSGTHEAVTNREYFVKLAEKTTKLVGQQSGEGAAYRVDMRLRPHGGLGALALSLADTARYYQTEAQRWERQVLIRSRASAGDADIYKAFFSKVEHSVFSTGETVENALSSVRLSKERIDVEHAKDRGFNVKLGRGGVREIEFIAQALQLAFGGRDRWLRAPHTLISLSRLADRKLIKKAEITELSTAYEFLRHLEHILQMEHGLQTHTVPSEPEKRTLIAKRMQCDDLEDFERALQRNTANVNRVFTRIFGDIDKIGLPAPGSLSRLASITDVDDDDTKRHKKNKAAIEKLVEAGKLESGGLPVNDDIRDALAKLADISPHFAQQALDGSVAIDTLPTRGSGRRFREDEEFELWSPLQAYYRGKDGPKNVSLKDRLGLLRGQWRQFLLGIVVLDVLEEISRKGSKRKQTKLAELAINDALSITRSEMEKRYSVEIPDLHLAVMGLGKLGGKGMDYGSDIDLILVYDDDKPLPCDTLSHLEFYSHAVEYFVKALSAMTLKGSLYRVDLRLRPYGKNGTSSISRGAFLDYLRTRSAMWEWLAYVKLRGVAGDTELARETETEARRIIHENAQAMRTTDPAFSELSKETRNVRLQLEKKRGGVKGREIDIKFGEGGMLDVYFLMRFLQLRDNVPDDAENRSTDFMLGKLLESKSLSPGDHAPLSEGYFFLSDLDHDLRLTVGRSTRVPVANRHALQTIAQRMGLESPADLLEKLTFHRLNIRAVFDRVVPA